MNNKITLRKNVLCLSIAAALCGAVPVQVFAADQVLADDEEITDSQKKASDSKDGEGIGTLIVTARRLGENLQKVPVSVTVVTNEQINEAGMDSIVAIESQAPNTTLFSSRGTSSTLSAYIRGVGQNDPLWGFEPGVGLYIDDVYVARPQGAVLDMLDVERIEILRGPQGTLYGKNTIGGAIKYITREPGLEPEFKASLGLGSFGQQDIKVAGSTSFADGAFTIGAAVGSFTRDGFGEVRGTSEFAGDDVSDKDVLSSRINLTWRPTDNLNIRLAADDTSDDSNTRGGGRLATSNVTGLAPLSDVHDTRQNLDPSGNEVNSSGQSLTVTWDINERWQLKSITGARDGDTFSNIDFDQLDSNDLDVIASYDDDQTTQEFQFSYDNGDNLTFIGGLYYYTGDASGTFDVVLGGLVGGLGFTLTTAGSVETDSKSIYGQATYTINDKWSATFGGRYTDDDKTAVVKVDAFLGVPGALIPFQSRSDFTNSASFSNFSPRLGVEYQANDNVMYYGSFSQGFKSGGFNMRANKAADPGADLPFQEETVDNYEYGFKARMLDDRIQLNGAIFYQDYQDKQVTTNTNVDLDGDGVNDTFVGRIINAGEVEATGVELEFIAQVTESFRIDANLGYIDSEFNEFDGFNLDGSPVDPGTVNIINTPDLTYNVGFKYDINMSNGSAIVFLGNVAFRDDVSIFEVDSPLDQESYTVYNASATYYAPDGNWRFTLAGRNLGDEEYRTAGYNFPDLGLEGSVVGFYGNPRTVTLTAEYSF